jgi:hypothetical protein
MAGKRRLSPAAKRAAYAAAAHAILERRREDAAPSSLLGGWTSAVVLVRAGIPNPRQAIADLQRDGVAIDERATAGRFVEWRLREQLPHERDAAIAREPE